MNQWLTSFQLLRKDLSKPQYNNTIRKSCSGVFTFLARTKALNSLAIWTLSEARFLSFDLWGNIRYNDFFEIIAEAGAHNG